MTSFLLTTLKCYRTGRIEFLISAWIVLVTRSNLIFFKLELVTRMYKNKSLTIQLVARSKTFYFSFSKWNLIFFNIESLTRKWKSKRLCWKWNLMFYEVELVTWKKNFWKIFELVSGSVTSFCVTNLFYI